MAYEAFLPSFAKIAVLEFSCYWFFVQKPSIYSDKIQCILKRIDWPPFCDCPESVLLVICHSMLCLVVVVVILPDPFPSSPTPFPLANSSKVPLGFRSWWTSRYELADSLAKLGATFPFAHVPSPSLCKNTPTKLYLETNSFSIFSLLLDFFGFFEETGPSSPCMWTVLTSLPRP